MNVLTDKLKITILTILCLVLLLTWALGAIMFRPGNTGNAISSALLNQRYVLEVSQISIQKGTEKIQLIKQKGLWIGKSDNLDFIADSNLVAQFINMAAKRRELFYISKNPSMYSGVALTGNQTVQVQFSSQEDIFSDLYFGTENYLGNKIYVRSGKKRDVYQIQNDVYSFLKTDPKSWADMQLVPGYLQFNAEDIIRFSISIRRGSDAETENIGYIRTASNTEKEKTADGYLQIIKSLRGSNVVQASDYQNTTPVAKIIFEKINTDSITLTIYEKKISGNASSDSLPSYIVICNTNKYGLETSGWTFNRLIGFNQ